MKLIVCLIYLLWVSIFLCDGKNILPKDTIVFIQKDTFYIKEANGTNAPKSKTDYANWVIAISTVIYTIGTFLLWRISHESITLSREQARRNEILLEHASMQTFYKNFRDLYSFILQDVNYASILSEARDIPIEQLRKNYLATFLINHAYELFLMHKKAMYSQEIWYTIYKDMRTLFKWNFVNERWSNVKDLYTKDFQDYIQKIILKE